MPRANIYIRRMDTEKWAAIKNKSEWIHNKLQTEPDVYLVGPKLAKKHPELVDDIKQAFGEPQVVPVEPYA